MLKNFVFTALLLNMLATYLSFNAMKKSSDRRFPRLFGTIGVILLVFMIGFTIDLFFNPTPLLLHAPALLWVLLIISIGIEMFSVFKKIVPGQLLAASLLIFLIMPTILGFGIYLLALAIIELFIAFIIFQKTKNLGFK